MAKKPKTESSSSSKGKGSKEPSWELEKRRFVTVREFKGSVYVDIREFYDAGGELKPGKKGETREWIISLERWKMCFQVLMVC